MDVHSRTTARIVAVLRRATAPLGTAAIAAKLDLSPNGVRDQLRALNERGLVERTRERRATGRPRDLWQLAPRAIADSDRPRTGWTMARSLARAIPATPERLAEVERAGIDMGLELACDVGLEPGSHPAETLDRALEAMGFEPERDPGTDPGRVRYRLMSCPYADAVRENPAVVCRLHKGVVRGVLACLDEEGSVVAFQPRDPDLAGCLVEVELHGPQPAGDDQARAAK